MANTSTEGGQPVNAVQNVRLWTGVRLDLSPGDDGRLERNASARGLAMGPYAPTAVFEPPNADDSRKTGGK